MIKMLTNTRIKARVSQSADSFGSTKAITVNKKHCHGNWTRMGTNYLSENLIRLLQQTCRAWFYPCCKHPSCCATAKLMYGKTSRKNVQLVSRLCCKTSWIAMLRYLLPTKKEKKKPCNLICCKTGSNVGVKRRTLLLNSFYSNVAEQVALFYCPFYSVALKTRAHEKNRTEAH